MGQKNGLLGTPDELALKGGLQTQSHYQPVRIDRDVAKIQEWVQWTRASRPIPQRDLAPQDRAPSLLSFCSFVEIL